MMTDQIRYRPGTMVAFISTRGFALGNTGLNISEQMEVLFDGTNVEVGGQRFTLPTLRGAIKLGWLVPSDQYDPDAPIQAAPSANIQVRSANDLGQNPMQPVKRGAITTVESDERIVMSRGQRAEAATQQTQAARAQQQRGGGIARSFNGSTAGIDVGGAEFGVPVARTFQTSARTETKVTPDSVGSAIRQADQVRVQPGEGISEHALLARMTEDEKSQYLAEKEARKGDVMSRGIGYVPPPSQNTNMAAYNQPGMQQRQAAQQPQRAQAAPSQSRVVGQVQQRPKVTQSEGFNITSSVGGGTEIADFSGMGGQVHESSVTAEGMTFKNTNGPKRAFPNTVQTSPQAESGVVAQAPSFEEATQSRIEKDGTADARKQIAKALCKDFPDEYCFSDHWKRRLAMVRLNYEGRTDIIRAIFAAESDDFKKLILEEFPEAFAS